MREQGLLGRWQKYRRKQMAEYIDSYSELRKATQALLTRKRI